MGVGFSEESHYCGRIFKHMLSDYSRYDLLILGPPNKTLEDKYLKGGMRNVFGKSFSVDWKLVNSVHLCGVFV